MKSSPYDYFDFPKSLPEVNLCNCIGPQAGQSKCPCSLRAEAQERLIENPFLPEDYKKRLQEWPKKKS